VYTPRNPFTPQPEEVFTPLEFLERHLQFHLWGQKNLATHQMDCFLENHRNVRNESICCLPAIKAGIDSELLKLAGCRSGLWVEPKGFRYWLNIAEERLQELEAGEDQFHKWNEILETANLYCWMTNIDPNKWPGFCLESFINACIINGYQPDPQSVSTVYYETEEIIR